MFEPGVPVHEQRESVIVGTLSGEHYLKERYDRPWYELYDGALPLIVGHHNIGGDKTPFIRSDGQVLGLDTSCYAGGALSAVLLPDFRIVSVPSRANRWAAVKSQHRDLDDAPPVYDRLSFEEIESLVGQARETPSAPAQARLEELAHLLDLANEAMAAIHAHVMTVHDRIIARLRAEAAYDSVDEKQGAHAYAAAIADPRIAPFLHAVRRGGLDTEHLRKRLGSPRRAVDLAAAIASGLEQ